MSHHAARLDGPTAGMGLCYLDCLAWLRRLLRQIDDGRARRPPGEPLVGDDPRGAIQDRLAGDEQARRAS